MMMSWGVVEQIQSLTLSLALAQSTHKQKARRQQIRATRRLGGGGGAWTATRAAAAGVAPNEQRGQALRERFLCVHTTEGGENMDARGCSQWFLEGGGVLQGLRERA